MEEEDLPYCAETMAAAVSAGGSVMLISETSYSTSSSGSNVTGM